MSNPFYSPYIGGPQTYSTGQHWLSSALAGVDPPGAAFSQLTSFMPQQMDYGLGQRGLAVTFDMVDASDMHISDPREEVRLQNRMMSEKRQQQQQQQQCAPDRDPRLATTYPRDEMLLSGRDGGMAGCFPPSYGCFRVCSDEQSISQGCLSSYQTPALHQATTSSYYTSSSSSSSATQKTLVSHSSQSSDSYQTSVCASTSGSLGGNISTTPAGGARSVTDGSVSNPCTTSSPASLYTSESASDLLAKFGLSATDMEYLSNYPDDQLTSDTLPIIIRDIKAKKTASAVWRSGLDGRGGVGSDHLGDSGGGVRISESPPVQQREVIDCDAVTTEGFRSREPQPNDTNVTVKHSQADIRAKGHMTMDMCGDREKVPKDSYCTLLKYDTSGIHNDHISTFGTSSNASTYNKSDLSPASTLFPFPDPVKRSQNEAENKKTRANMPKDVPVWHAVAEQLPLIQERAPGHGVNANLVMVLSGGDGGQGHRTSQGQSQGHRTVEGHRTAQGHRTAEGGVVVHQDQHRSLWPATFSTVNTHYPHPSTMTFDPSAPPPHPERHVMPPPPSSGQVQTIRLQLPVSTTTLPKTATMTTTSPTATTGKRLPTAAMMSDHSEATPRVFPHTCSLCNIECVCMKEWIAHRKTKYHFESSRLLRQLYPDWSSETGVHSPVCRDGQSFWSVSQDSKRCSSSSCSWSRSPSPRRCHGDASSKTSSSSAGGGARSSRLQTRHRRRSRSRARSPRRPIRATSPPSPSHRHRSPSRRSRSSPSRRSRSPPSRRSRSPPSRRSRSPPRQRLRSRSPNRSSNRRAARETSAERLARKILESSAGRSISENSSMSAMVQSLAPVLLAELAKKKKTTSSSSSSSRGAKHSSSSSSPSPRKRERYSPVRHTPRFRSETTDIKSKDSTKSRVAFKSPAKAKTTRSIDITPTSKTYTNIETETLSKQSIKSTVNALKCPEAKSKASKSNGEITETKTNESDKERHTETSVPSETKLKGTDTTAKDSEKKEVTKVKESGKPKVDNIKAEESLNDCRPKTKATGVKDQETAKENEASTTLTVSHTTPVSTEQTPKSTSSVSVSTANSSKQPAKISTTPETSSASTANGSKQPASISTTPETCSVLTANCSKQPASISAIQETCSVSTASSPKQPASLSTTPETCSVSTANSSKQPASISTTPETSSASRANSSKQPASISTFQETCSISMANSSKKPASISTIQEACSVSSANSSKQQASMSATPETPSVSMETSSIPTETHSVPQVHFASYRWDKKPTVLHIQRTLKGPHAATGGSVKTPPHSSGSKAQQSDVGLKVQESAIKTQQYDFSLKALESTMTTQQSDWTTTQPAPPIKVSAVSLPFRIPASITGESLILQDNGHLTSRVAMVTNLPESGYTEDDIVKMATPHGYKHGPDTLYILPHQRRAFLVCPSLQILAKILKFYDDNPHLLLGCQLTFHLVTEPLDFSKLKAYTTLMNLSNKRVVPNNSLLKRLLCVTNYNSHALMVSSVCKQMQRFGRIRTVLPLLNKLYVEMAKEEGACSVVSWHSDSPLASEYSVSRVSSNPVAATTNAVSAVPTGSQAASSSQPSPTPPTLTQTPVGQKVEGLPKKQPSKENDMLKGRLVIVELSTYTTQMADKVEECVRRVAPFKNVLPLPNMVYFEMESVTAAESVVWEYRSAPYFSPEQQETFSLSPLFLNAGVTFKMTSDNYLNIKQPPTTAARK